MTSLGLNKLLHHSTFLHARKNWVCQINRYQSSFKYSRNHEWLKTEHDNDALLVGISDYAQKALGDIVFVDLPKRGSCFKKNGASSLFSIVVTIKEAVGVVESVKGATDIFSPVSCEVLEANFAVLNRPSIINSSSQGEGKLVYKKEYAYVLGWLLKIKPTETEELDDLMEAAEYEKFCNSA